MDEKEVSKNVKLYKLYAVLGEANIMGTDSDITLFNALAK